MSKVVINQYIVTHRDSVLWCNRGRLFWVKLHASRLLRHSGVKKFLTHTGAIKASQLMGGMVALESQLSKGVQQSTNA